MSRGFYIIANDRAAEQAIAFMKSLRFYDSETPVMLIPYDDKYQGVAEILTTQFGVQVYQDLEFIDRLSVRLQQTFGEKFFARPNQFRKQACWFGPFDEFVYIDTDIVVFEKIADSMNYLADHDFICDDYQHLQGISNVFTSQVIEAGVFQAEELQDIFNGGFWGSKKGLISEEDLYATFTECAAHPEYFDFSQKTSDQPIINYMILKRLPRRLNRVRAEGKGPGNWAGSRNFKRQGNILIDTNINQPLHYLHWAGIRIEPGCPYWDIWEHYRYLGEEKPPVQTIASPAQSTLWQRAIRKVRKMLSN